MENCVVLDDLHLLRYVVGYKYLEMHKLLLQYQTLQKMLLFTFNIAFLIQALVVDLDRGKFLKRFGDESVILPRKLYKYLQHELVGERLPKSIVHSVLVNLYL